MKNYSIYKTLTILSLIALSGALASCSSSPEVTRYVTVEEYNRAQEMADYVLIDMGYKAYGYRASTYYDYVLFDDNKKCREGCFCTASDSYNHISPHDRCVKCGRAWNAHDDY